MSFSNFKNINSNISRIPTPILNRAGSRQRPHDISTALDIFNNINIIVIV